MPSSLGEGQRLLVVARSARSGRLAAGGDGSKKVERQRLAAALTACRRARSSARWRGAQRLRRADRRAVRLAQRSAWREER